MFVILKLNGSIFRKPVRTQGTTKGTNKGEKRLSGHILRLLMFCPSGLLTASSLSPHTYRLVSVNLAPARYWPGGQSDQESPGVVMEEVVVVEGPLTCGLPRQLKAARFCWRLGVAGVGIVMEALLKARYSPALPAWTRSLRPRLRQRELGRSHGGPSPPSHPSRTPASQGGGPSEHRQRRAASLTRTARSSLPLGRPSPPPPPHPPAGRAGPPASYPVRGPGPASARLCRVATRIWEASPAHGAAGVGPTCGARASGSPGAATRLRGPHNQPGLSGCVAAAAGSGRQLPTAPRPSSRHQGHQNPFRRLALPGSQSQARALWRRGRGKDGEGKWGVGTERR